MTKGVTTTVKVKVDQAGVDELTKNPAGPTGQLVSQTARKGLSKALAAVPVDTGDLRASIGVRDRSEPSGPVSEITVVSEHWHFVEYGTRYTRPWPFLRHRSDRESPMTVIMVNAEALVRAWLLDCPGGDRRGRQRHFRRGPPRDRPPRGRLPARRRPPAVQHPRTPTCPLTRPTSSSTAGGP